MYINLILLIVIGLTCLDWFAPLDRFWRFASDAGTGAKISKHFYKRS
jgi:hypothetical protein